MKGAAAMNVTTPYPVGYAGARLYRHDTRHRDPTRRVRHRAGRLYLRVQGNWSAVHNVANTWSGGARLGLADTSTGLRLIASVADSSYQPVVSKWTGSGFSKPSKTGDHNRCSPRSHDTVADASGRLADISDDGCSDIAVTNLPDTVHAAVVRFAAGGTINASEPRVATTPRGTAFAVWSIEAGTSDRLLLVPVLLPDLTTTKTQASSAGSVTVTGPVSCLPADDISVGVKGTPAKNWHVQQQSLKLGTETVGTTLSGASLTAGKTYTLTGQVTFADGSKNQSASAAVTFKACPAP